MNAWLEAHPTLYIYIISPLVLAFVGAIINAFTRKRTPEEYAALPPRLAGFIRLMSALFPDTRKAIDAGNQIVNNALPANPTRSLQPGETPPSAKPDDAPKPPSPPPLPTLFMSIVMAIALGWTFFIVGCNGSQQNIVRNAARADVLLVADGAVKMQSLCADLAMQRKDLELAKACAASYDETRATLLATESLIDAWDEASASHFVCSMVKAVDALGSGVRAFAGAGGKVPPAIDDALALGKQLAGGCSN